MGTKLFPQGLEFLHNENSSCSRIGSFLSGWSEEGCSCHTEVHFSVSSLSGEKTPPKERPQSSRQEPAGRPRIVHPRPSSGSSHRLPWPGYPLRLGVFQPDLSSHIYTQLGVPQAPPNQQSPLPSSPLSLLHHLLPPSVPTQEPGGGISA